MANWTVSYAQKPIPGIPAVHGMLIVRDGNGNVVRSFDGLATDPQGNAKPIGTTADDSIKFYAYDHRLPANYDTTFPEQTLFSGSQEDVAARMKSAEAAGAMINDANIGYPIMGFGQTSRTLGRSNSNAVISTLLKAMDVNEPTTTLSAYGQGQILLPQSKLESIQKDSGVRQPDSNSDAAPTAPTVPFPVPRPLNLGPRTIKR